MSFSKGSINRSVTYATISYNDNSGNALCVGYGNHGVRFDSFECYGETIDNILSEVRRRWPNCSTDII